jgi:hypothetical protein
MKKFEGNAERWKQARKYNNGFHLPMKYVRLSCRIISTAIKVTEEI